MAGKPEDSIPEILLDSPELEGEDEEKTALVQAPARRASAPKPAGAPRPPEKPEPTLSTAIRMAKDDIRRGPPPVSYPAPSYAPRPDEDDGPTDPQIRVPVPRPAPAPKARAAAPASAPPPPARAVAAPSLQAQAPAPQAQAQARPLAPPEPPTPARPAMPAPRMPELGPLESFMKDPEVTEIMINDIRNVMIERAGKMSFSGFAFQSVDEVNRIVRNILDITGRILSPDQPYVDTMLPDGSRVNIVGPPLTLLGPSVTIRKFPSRAFGAEDLIQSQMLDRKIAHFLSLCVAGRRNIIISGGTGSGKTTLLNVLMTFVPKGERLVTIEDTPELAVSHFNSVRLQTKPQTPASLAITARELLANSLRMRPDRVIVGECRRSEAFDMLQAMNTGHEGSMTTIHSNSPRDALARLETLCMTAEIEMPLLAIRKQIQSAIDLIIQLKRFRDGKRRIVAVSEVTGMEGEIVTLQEIFLYDPEKGNFGFTGFVPSFVESLAEYGVEIPPGYFA